MVPSFKEAGRGPAVIFMHGIGGNRHAFDEQLSRMQDHFRCIAWDMPGYGGSQSTPEMSFDTLSAALGDLLDHLGLASAHLVGHSMGGMVAQAFVAQCPRRVDRLVLAQTSARFGKPGSDWQQAFLAARLKPLDDGKTPADFAGTLIRSMFADPGRQREIDQAIATMSPLPASVYRQTLGALVQFDCQEALQQIDCPTLCLAADHDETAPAGVMEKMAAAIPGARFVCLPDAGHLAYVEQAAAFTAAVDEFLCDGGDSP
jgi:pimeloyl-ACP methyl ester carboxylesterase